MSSWGCVQNSCPQCDGNLEWFDFGSDCRGGGGSAGVSCQTNNCKLTKVQINTFWSELFAKQQAEWDASVAADKVRLAARQSMPKDADILAAGAAAVDHFQYLADCGALDHRKDGEHVAALRQLLLLAKKLTV